MKITLSFIILLLFTSNSPKIIYQDCPIYKTDPLSKYELRDNRNRVDAAGALVGLTESTVKFKEAAEQYGRKHAH